MGSLGELARAREIESEEESAEILCVADTERQGHLGGILAGYIAGSGAFDVIDPAVTFHLLLWYVHLPPPRARRAHRGYIHQHDSNRIVLGVLAHVKRDAVIPVPFFDSQPIHHVMFVEHDGRYVGGIVAHSSPGFSPCCASTTAHCYQPCAGRLDAIDTANVCD